VRARRASAERSAAPVRAYGLVGVGAAETAAWAVDADGDGDGVTTLGRVVTAAVEPGASVAEVCATEQPESTTVAPRRRTATRASVLSRGQATVAGMPVTRAAR
jgi:hypothetical protein